MWMLNHAMRAVCTNNEIVFMNFDHRATHIQIKVPAATRSALHRGLSARHTWALWMLLFCLSLSKRLLHYFDSLLTAVFSEVSGGSRV